MKRSQIVHGHNFQESQNIRQVLDNLPGRQTFWWKSRKIKNLLKGAEPSKHGKSLSKGISHGMLITQPKTPMKLLKNGSVEKWFVDGILKLSRNTTIIRFCSWFCHWTLFKGSFGMRKDVTMFIYGVFRKTRKFGSTSFSITDFLLNERL